MSWLAVLAASLIVSLAILRSVYLMRPRVFRFRATVTRWLNIEIEIRDPHRP